MSKVFRLYTGGSDTYQGWNDNPSFPYNSTSRDTIDDPDGASARNEITSIPSPFARIDLIKTAFKEVAKSQRISALDGNTIFHKMVSDTLDVAEIFFNIDKYKNKIEVIKWDPSAMLSELAQSYSQGHRFLADSLDKYLKSDAMTYNFGQMQNIYLLNYVNGPDELNIIGATSPATLFFSNANDLSFVNDVYFSDNDIPFDKDYQPLYKRDFEFVKYLFTLRATIPNFANLFPEVDAYLALTYKAIADDSLKQELRNVSNSTIAEFDAISVVDVQQNNNVEVLGHVLYKKKVGTLKNSEFTIKSEIYDGTLPVVLPVEAGNKYSDLQYTSGKWGKTNAAPFVEIEEDLSKRVLPFDGSLQPYLTISDLLEDSIIRVPHNLNREHYFDGNIKIKQNELAYLLPIKTRFFEFFTVEDLRGEVFDGKPMLEMELLASESVKVILRVPIVGNNKIGYIEYTRSYYNNRASDVQRNEGGMIEFNFTGFVMPQVKFINPNDAIYNIACVNGSSLKYTLNFYNSNIRVSPTMVNTRNENKEHTHTATNYLIEHENFDFIRVLNRDNKGGLLIPIFRPQRNIESYEFAIDLGTSNTHIEYRKPGGTPEVFKIDKNDVQMCTFFVRSKDEDGVEYGMVNEIQLIEKDYLPQFVGQNDYKFPTRTVLSSAKTVDWTNAVAPFMLANIPLTYDKREPISYNRSNYNIKWGKGNEQAVMDVYVRCLMLMIRNKVLLNNGDLSKTKITWFYPISMAPKRLKNLQTTWDEAYNSYFGVGSTNRMTESAAPIQYFFRRYSTSTDLVNVDIGGGTTDIAFAKDKDIIFVTSFRFAANQLFENPFSDIETRNGIVDWFKTGIKNLLEDKRLNELVGVYNSESNQNPSNMASFLFSLRDNSLIQKNDVNLKSVDFNYILQQDENFKIVFILFYTAIIYHIAQIVKNRNLDVPRHISFSGNGSKIIRVITTDSKLLAKYTKMVFEKLLGHPYGKELEILGLDKDSNPKESTCKGGLIGNETEDNRDKIIVFKSDCTGIVGEEDTYENIDHQYKVNSIKAVKDFFNFVLDTMNGVFNFNDNFGINPVSMKIASSVCYNDLNTFLDKGIAQRKEECEGKDKIEETFFFYPIKGVLDVLSTEIYNSLFTKQQSE